MRRSSISVPLEGNDQRRFFTDLVASGRFCRDTPMGGILHRGTISLREISPGDGLHVCIDPHNRVSVHVDHLSPVAGGRADGTCRYSLGAVARHLVAHLGAQMRRMVRGARGQHRCRLDCELVEVDEQEASTAVAEVLQAPRDPDCRAPTTRPSPPSLAFPPRPPAPPAGSRQ